MTEKMQNMPTPTMMYPKSSGIYLMSRVQELTANVADLINELVQRDTRIAAMETLLNDRVALKQRLEDLEATAIPPALVEHADIRKAQGNGADT